MQSSFHKALSGVRVISDISSKSLEMHNYQKFPLSKETFLFESQCVFSSCLLCSAVWSKDSEGAKYILLRTLGAGIREIQLCQTDAIPGSDSFI